MRIQVLKKSVWLFAAHKISLHTIVIDASSSRVLNLKLRFEIGSHEENENYFAMQLAYFLVHAVVGWVLKQVNSRNVKVVQETLCQRCKQSHEPLYVICFVLVKCSTPIWFHLVSRKKKSKHSNTEPLIIHYIFIT